jgi:hypothetical protein
VAKDSHGRAQGAGRRLRGWGHERSVGLGSRELGKLAIASLVAHVGEDLRGLVVVRLVALDKRPAVDVDDHAARPTAQKVEPAHALPESLDNVARVPLLELGELGDEARLLAVGVTLH